MKLYDIPREIEDFENELIQNGGELTEDLEKRWHGFVNAGKDKIEAACCVVVGLQAQQEACEKEAKRLTEKAAQHEHNVKRLKDLMIYAVDALGGKVKTSLFTVWTQTSASQIKVEMKEGTDLAKLEITHPQFVRVKREANIEAIKKAVELIESQRQEVGELKPDAIPGFIVSHTQGTHFLRIK